MAQQERSKKTREDILLAASRLINERTWDHSSITRIAQEAGYTTGAMYFHFAVKEDIALAIIEEQNKRSSSAAAETLNRNLPAVETILQISAGFTRDILADPLVQAGARLTSQPQMFTNPPLLPWASWAAVHAQNLSRGIQEGDVKPEIDVHRYAAHFNGASAGTFLLSGLSNGLADLTERASDLSIILLSSYVVPEKQEYWAKRALAIYGVTESPLRYDNPSPHTHSTSYSAPD
ncbi:TetR/AcrR family transcriptional regulator [Agromyces aerolatus]|uniref:TetR/AcrR family transcriptional regulator n=1 Tax=Agromyces sp. LY-1074 TaxID=3074080 RepID=UPI00285F08CC|nr:MULTISPECIES: TetR/AcrR family transcriptional regulator [unclassified Agromyces]MDR5700169.1 TetR/AcrR family transcriptional regulator [Agromyces sp. LY-1074]MDR5706463.1 TetR/AcrR family transcriptional regulator [Agromyces sp. LY-1358]